MGDDGGGSDGGDGGGSSEYDGDGDNCSITQTE